MVTAKERPDWVRRHLSGSIYLWACGEKAEKDQDDDDEDLTLSDGLVGWLVLLVQGLLYTALFVRAGNASISSSSSSSSSATESDVDDDSSGQRDYSIAAISAAMYLVVATTLPDLRAGFSLVGNGLCAGHRVFGIGLLVVYGLMLSTAMKVLATSLDDDATVVLSAVLVLFVADLDAKALTFFLTVPKQWRLFWAILSIWISGVLALAAVVCFGDSSDHNLNILPSWYFVAVSPGAVALCSVVLGKALHNFLESCSEPAEGVDEVTLGLIASNGCAAFSAAMKRSTQRFGEDRCFYSVRALWLAQGVISWWVLTWIVFLPVAFDVPPFQVNTGDEQDSLTFTGNLITLSFSIVVLVIGLAWKLCGFCLPSQESSAILLGDPASSDSRAGRTNCGGCADARIPSLLVGWGAGYWVTSLLYVLGGSWHGGGWTSAPTAVVVAAYVIIPCFFIVAFFMLVNPSLLGESIGALVTPALGVLKDTRRVLYWVLATVLRDILLLWVLFSLFVVMLGNSL